MSLKFLLLASFARSVLNFRGDLIAALIEKGIEVHIAVPVNGEEKGLSSLKALGVVIHDIPLHRTGLNPLADMWLLVRLVQLFRKVKPDTVLCYTIKPIIYGSFASYLAGVPRCFVLITGLGYAFTNGRRNWLTKVIQWMYGAALRRVHKVFFQNPDDQSLFLELGIITKNIPSVVVNGSGVDLVSFCLTPFEGTLSFLMIGRLLGDKGVREYVRAAKSLRSHHPEVRFLLVGWIDENPDAISPTELDAWINDGSIDFLGHLDDVRPAIQACTVYVLPSYREGTPRTVLEAMAMGRPVITTDAPGCRETVVDGDNGFLVPVKSPDALVNAMRRFIDDATLAPRMGQHSRRIAVDKYDVHKVNAVMLHEMGITEIDETKVKRSD